MTLWDLCRAMLRFWPIVIVGGLCTALVGLMTVRDDGVYFTRTELVFMAPTSTLYQNALRTQSEDLIITAGAVAKIVAGPSKVTKYSTPDVTLVGLGTREGWALTLPDTGGQWATNFASQVLLLDIVGPDEATVKGEQQRLIAETRSALLTLQQDADVDPVNFITMMPAPESTVVFQVGSSRFRALGMTALLGIGLTGVCLVMAERRRRRRSPD